MKRKGVIENELICSKIKTSKQFWDFVAWKNAIPTEEQTEEYKEAMSISPKKQQVYYSNNDFRLIFSKIHRELFLKWLAEWIYEQEKKYNIEITYEDKRFL